MQTIAVDLVISRTLHSKAYNKPNRCRIVCFLWSTRHPLFAAAALKNSRTKPLVNRSRAARPRKRLFTSSVHQTDDPCRSKGGRKSWRLQTSNRIVSQQAHRRRPALVDRAGEPKPNTVHMRPPLKLVEPASLLQRGPRQRRIRDGVPAALPRSTK